MRFGYLRESFTVSKISSKPGVTANPTSADCGVLLSETVPRTPSLNFAMNVYSSASSNIEISPKFMINCRQTPRAHAKKVSSRSSRQPVGSNDR